MRSDITFVKINFLGIDSKLGVLRFFCLIPNSVIRLPLDALSIVVALFALKIFVICCIMQVMLNSVNSKVSSPYLELK